MIRPPVLDAAAGDRVCENPHDLAGKPVSAQLTPAGTATAAQHR